MKRYRQTLAELLAALSAIETTSMDEHSAAVIKVIEAVPRKAAYSQDDLAVLFAADFEAGLTAARLFLGLSKQNHGRIARIYTQSMAAELEADLRQLRRDHSLPRPTTRRKPRPEAPQDKG